MLRYLVNDETIRSFLELVDNVYKPTDKDFSDLVGVIIPMLAHDKVKLVKAILLTANLNY